MKKALLITFVFVMTLMTQSIAQATFIVQSLPANTPPQDSIYMAGDFSGWEAGLPEYRMHKNDSGYWSITLAAQEEGKVIKFKFTRGTWATVEKGAAGEEISDRTFAYGNGDNVIVTIANWAETGTVGNSTAASNVKIMSPDFYMPQPDRKRRIWVYFPPGYETSGIRYPVLYMHDGQNLFDAITSFSGEWEVDETLNKLADEGKQVPIVIGIDNGGSNRIGEYTPWPNSGYGGGEGEKYMQFIVETLKPYVDQHYRTLADRQNTGIMGSSLGGLISHYGSLRYQETFGKAGLFSPSYWFSDSVWAFAQEAGKKQEMRFYQLCGTNESAGMVGEMQRMNDTLVSIGFNHDNVHNKTVAGGQHNEKLWREAFGEAYLWLFDAFANAGQKPSQTPSIDCYPNPTGDILTYSTGSRIVFDSVAIVDMKGRLVKSIRNPLENKIDVHDLLPGTYIIKCSSGEIRQEGKFIKN